MSEIDEFLAARDFLMRHRDDCATAYDSFRWPAPTRFNWALDYFDRIADAEKRTALWIVEETGTEKNSPSPISAGARTRSPIICASSASGAASASC